MKKSTCGTILVVTLCCLTALAVGQTTTVTLQATDTDGQSWNNGSWTASLYAPPGVPNGPFVIIGTSTPVPNQTQSGLLSVTGGASGLTFTPNLSIAPSGTQWQFTFCSAAAPTQCFQYQIVIAGASQTIAQTLPGIRVSTTNPLVRATAYRDGEITGALQGTFYFNLTDLTLHVCNVAAGGICTTWTTSLTAAGMATPPPIGQTTPNTGAFTTLSATGLVNLGGLTASQIVGTDASKNLVSITVLPNGTTATTQAALDNTTKVATTAYANLAVGVETTRATTAEGLLAPQATPTFTGSPQVSGVGTQVLLTNPTPGTVLTTNASPSLGFAAFGWNSSSSFQNKWQIGLSMPAGINTLGTLAFTYAGAGSGTVSFPAIQFGATNDTGLSRLAAGTIGVGNGANGDWTGNLRLARAYFSRANATTYDYVLDPSVYNNLSLSNSFGLGWSSTTNANAAQDTGLSRTGAGVVAVGNGTVGDASGTVTAATVQGAQVNSTGGLFLGAHSFSVPTISVATTIPGIGSGNGLLNLRDATSGGNAVFILDPNVGPQLLGASHITGLAGTGIALSGSWQITLTAGTFPRTLTWTLLQ
jgi:hypothetical protein